MVARLSYTAVGPHSLCNGVGGRALEPMHDLRQRKLAQPKNQMYVIRHHYCGIELDYPMLIQPTCAGQHNLRRIWIPEKRDSIATAGGQQIEATFRRSSAVSQFAGGSGHL